MADQAVAELGPYAAGFLGLLSSAAAALRFSGRLADLESRTKAQADAIEELSEALDKVRADLAAASNMGPASVSGASLRVMVSDIVTGMLSALKAEVTGALTSFRAEMERIRSEHDRDRERGVTEWKEFYRLVGSFQRALKDKESD